MRRFTVSAILPLLIITTISCASTVPPELVTANKYEAQALAAIRANRAIIVDAYTNELRAAYSKQMDLIQKSALDGAQRMDTQGNMVVPRAIADQVIELRNTKEAEIDAKLEVKKKEFLNDPNLAIAEELNAKVGEWMKVYVEEFAGRVQELARLGEGLYEGLTGNEAPRIFDNISGSNQ